MGRARARPYANHRPRRLCATSTASGSAGPLPLQNGSFVERRGRHTPERIVRSESSRLHNTAAVPSRSRSSPRQIIAARTERGKSSFDKRQPAWDHSGSAVPSSATNPHTPAKTTVRACPTGSETDAGAVSGASGTKASGRRGSCWDRSPSSTPVRWICSGALHAGYWSRGRGPPGSNGAGSAAARA